MADEPSRGRAQSQNGQVTEAARVPKQPKPRIYHPPPVDVCTTTCVPIRRSNPGQEVKVWVSTYRNLIVDFSVEQIARSEGTWSTICKIAVDEGEIRRYDYRRANDQPAHVARLHLVSADKGWEQVDRHYPDAVQMMQDEWDDNLRRWNGDSA